MFKLSDDYYLRKFYLDSETVPTQTVMKKKMSPGLAEVYFKSMLPKLKELAGLEPPLKGGGSDWYVPPKELLDGRAVMKPIKREFITKLGFKGIDFLGEKIVNEHHKHMEEEKRNALLQNDIKWKHIIQESCNKQWDDTSREQSKENTSKIQKAFQQYTILYMRSITNIDSLLRDAAFKEVERVKQEAFDMMNAHYETLLKQQATMLYDRYAEKLLIEKNKLKDKFVSDVENARTELGNKIHDINLDKHVAIEKLRVLLECQNLACQVYVALKEREECKKEMELTKHEHEKTIKKLSERIRMQDFEIKLEIEKEKKRKEVIQIWQKKICHVIKRFQQFVKYCLKTLPEQADFFINMEKLMLLQLSEAMENPSVESIFVPEEDGFHTPVAKPHPYYVFCDKGFKPKVEEHLCPKHCTSSASQLPVIVVNKRLIYSACDNFELFADKLTEFLEGHQGDEADFVDSHDYTYDIPIKPTESTDKEQVKQESSLMQILQNEIPNPRQVKIECSVCKVSTCYCESSPKIVRPLPTEDYHEFVPWQPTDIGRKIKYRRTELEHEREPKWDSYLNFVYPKRCHCPRKAKKHLHEHLPAYMRNMSSYEPLDLPFYEKCPLDKLKKLVKKSRRQQPLCIVPDIVKVESKTRDVSTQYSDQEFEYLCSCFSEEEIDKILRDIIKCPKKDNIESFTSTNLLMSPTTFARDRARSLRRLLNEAPELEEIFRRDDAQFKCNSSNFMSHLKTNNIKTTYKLFDN